DAHMTAMADRNDAEVTALIDELSGATSDSDVKAKLSQIQEAARRALLTARVRADMIAMQRAEKNLILARQPEEMKSYADVIEQTANRIEQRVAEIESTASDRNKAVLAEFATLAEQWIANSQ